MTHVLAALLLALGEISLETPLDPSLQPFVPAGQVALAVESADLNGDGTLDYLLITEDPRTGEEFDGARTLLVITRSADKSLKLAARSDRVVLCRECGGLYGDPFDNVSAARKTFTVRHYGGSNWRWAHEFTFGYSRRDRAWQLVKAVETSYHVSDIQKEERHVYVPPRDFGLIDLVDFDPDDYLGKGRK